jgi:hypothetical protein
MTQALCLRCGAIKRGALCDCIACGAPEDPDSELAIALSDHHLPVAALQRLGELVAALAAATPDGDLRRAALLEFFRARFTERYHRDVAAELVDPARALLATVPQPAIRVVVQSPEEAWRQDLWRRATFGTRVRLWQAVAEEQARNPALVATGRPERPGSPDLTVVDLATMTTVAMSEPELAVGEGTTEQLERARLVVELVGRRRASFEHTGSLLAAYQRAFLVGEASAPLPVGAGVIGEPHPAFRKALLRCGGSDHEIAALLGAAFP